MIPEFSYSWWVTILWIWKALIVSKTHSRKTLLDITFIRFIHLLPCHCLPSLLTIEVFPLFLTLVVRTAYVLSPSWFNWTVVVLVLLCMRMIPISSNVWVLVPLLVDCLGWLRGVALLEVMWPYWRRHVTSVGFQKPHHSQLSLFIYLADRV